MMVIVVGERDRALIREISIRSQRQSAKSEKGSEVEPLPRGVVVDVVEGVREIPNRTWIPAG